MLLSSSNAIKGTLKHNRLKSEWDTPLQVGAHIAMVSI